LDYRCGDWQATRRFVAVRQRLPKKESPQLDLLETTEYDYFWASFITRFALFAITDLIKQEKAKPFPV